MLRLEKITVLRGKRIILKGLSAEAGRGDVVALIGANGAGKTTLLQCIAGALKNEAGDILYLGEKIDTSSVEWRSTLSCVLEDGGIIPLLSVEEQIYLQCLLSGLGTAESRKRAEFIIDLFDLEGYKAYRGEELSSGTRKKLGIALGVVRDADIFLFDEPFSTLDLSSMAVFNRVLMCLKNSGKISVVASHSFPFPSGIYNRAWTLSEGAITGHPEEETIRRNLELQFRNETHSTEEIRFPWIQSAR
jgi:ABC-2 type transport system ATP-binding protein